MTIRTLSLLFAGAVLAVAVGCSSNKSANTNATATEGKKAACCATDGTCKDKAPAVVNATATEKKDCCEAGKACCEAMKSCTEKKANPN